MNTINNGTTELTPQARLAISRQAIVRHMHHDEQNVASRDSSGRLEDGADHPKSTNSWGVIKNAVRSWWEHHPASTALDLAEPLIGQYARDKPFRLLGIAAGAGVAIAVFKPWRLISLGGVLLAAMKSSDVSSVIFSILSPASNESVHSRKHP